MTRIVCRKRNRISAIKFDGINFKEMMEFIPETWLECKTINNNGYKSYTLYLVDYRDSLNCDKKTTCEITRGSWVVFEDNIYKLMSEDKFLHKYEEYREESSEEGYTEGINICVKPIKFKKRDDGDYSVIDSTGFSSVVSDESFHKTCISVKDLPK